MTAFWDIGLCELSDFTDFPGDRMLTYPELKSRHTGKALTGRHRKSFTLLCSYLKCEEGGVLSPEYRPEPTVTDLHAILKKYTHTRTPGLIARHDLELEREDNERSISDQPRDRSRRLKLPKRKRYKKSTPRPNPDIRPPPSASSAQGLRIWSYKDISAARWIDGVEQWRVHWLGGDSEGPYEPTWEPIESFNEADEHPTDTLGRVRRGETMALKDLATIRPSNSNRTWSNKRVRARVFVEVNGVEVPIFKDGTMVVNPDKTLTSNLPYVLK